MFTDDQLKLINCLVVAECRRLNKLSSDPGDKTDKELMSLMEDQIETHILLNQLELLQLKRRAKNDTIAGEPSDQIQQHLKKQTNRKERET